MTTFNQFVTSFVNPFRSKMSEVLRAEKQILQAILATGSVPITRHRLKWPPTADERLWITPSLPGIASPHSSGCS
jgi:hypothetical protein